MISAIVAVDNNWGIGYNSDLLEHIPEDLKRFKQLTTGNVVVMGRKTWDSLPKKPLPDRLNLVISRQDRTIDFMTAFIGMEEAKVRAGMAAKDPEDEWFVIGGGQIYEELLPYCNRVYVTKIYKDHENVDTYFPNLDKIDGWEIIGCTGPREYNGIMYTFLTYDRLN